MIAVILISCKKSEAIEPKETPIVADTTIVIPQSRDSVIVEEPTTPEAITYGLHLPIKTNDTISAQIIEHVGYVTNYNKQWYIPNWVAYILEKKELTAVVERDGAFVPDPKAEGEKVTTNQYTKSGYDRGHMAPAADMKWSATAMEECMYLSNICPQAPGLNRGRWLTLENKVRDWAEKYDSVLVICGPIMEQPHKTIGSIGIAVPWGYFKIIARKTAKEYKAISFIMKNESCPNTLYEYAVTIDSIETLTGHDFFYTLTNEQQNQLESQVETKGW